MDNRTRKLLAGIILATGLSAADAYAHDRDNNPPGNKGGPGTNWENPPGPEGGRGASPDHQKRHWKEKADTNQDGVVDDAEKEAAKAHFKEKRIEKFKKRADTNGDGVLDDTERAQAEAKHAEWKAKADTDQDGRVDRKEKRAAKELYGRKHGKD